MKIKVLFSVCLIVLSLASFSQERFGTSEKVLNKLKNSSLQVSTGHISSEMDDALKSALDKYWNFCPVEYVDNKDVDKGKPTLMLGNFEIKSWTNYSYTKLAIINSNWTGYSCHFDNLTAKSQCVGIDQTDTEIKYKINLAVKNLAAQVRFLDNAYTEKKTKGLNSWEGFKDRLATTTVLIPQEYLSNGLTKNAFKGIKKKEFVPLKEINQRLEDDKGKGYSTLVTYVSVMGSYFNIIDLDTGDFIYRHDFGAVFQKGMSGMPDKITDKDIVKIIDKMNEKD